MKKRAAHPLLVFACIALLAGGCAKSETVKSDRPLAPAAAAANTAAAEPPQAAPAQAELAVERPAAQAPIRTGEDREELQPMPHSGELAAALEKIHFDFDRHALSQEARDALASYAEQLKRAPEVKLRIAGHCDERGSDAYNLALSEKRARAAKQYLFALGVDAERLSVIGYGKEKPIAPGHDEASWAENRRAEFEIEAQ